MIEVIWTKLAWPSEAASTPERECWNPSGGGLVVRSMTIEKTTRIGHHTTGGTY